MAAVKFAERFGHEMNVTVLVDFANHSLGTALEVADALDGDLWGIRLDTSDKLADAGAPGASTATTRRPASTPSSCGSSAKGSTTPATAT